MASETSYIAVIRALERIQDDLNSEFMPTENIKDAINHIKEAVELVEDEERSEYESYKNSEQGKKDLENLKKKSKEIFNDDFIGDDFGR